LSDHRLVRRDLCDLELVDLIELLCLGGCGARHARELLVHAEIVLDRDRGEGAGLALDLETFLPLDRLVQPVAPAPSRHETAGEMMMSGVRASSMRIESASSTTAKLRPCCTWSLRSMTMLSRR